MPYVVDIVRVHPQGPEPEAGMPRDRLPLAYDTVEDAVAVAEAYLRQRGASPGTVFYKIVDEATDEPV